MSDRNDDVKVYQDKKAKAEDYKSSAYTLLMVGVLGIAAFILMEAGVLPFRLAGSGKYITYERISCLPDQTLWKKCDVCLWWRFHQE